MTQEDYEPALTDEEEKALASYKRGLMRKRAQAELTRLRMSQGCALVLDVGEDTYWTMPGDGTREGLQPFDPEGPTPDIP